jgi:beta-lactamase superfamily II metal-dependent hydrolase
MEEHDMASDDSTGEIGGRVRIRMYRVGFGDFFLMSVPAAGGDYAHILIDCGVHAHDRGLIGDAVKQMKADTGGKLALIIMTHRHADHISGFGSARDVFETFAVERVWMSWFEDPANKKALAIQAGIAATAQHLQAALAMRAGPDDEQYMCMAENALGIAKGGGNAGALEMLHSFKTSGGNPTPVDYYGAGDPPTLPPSLAAAGLEADILGPPRDLSLVAQMDNAAHQYLEAAAFTAGEDEGKTAIFSNIYSASAFPWPKNDQPVFTPEEIEGRIVASQPDALAAAAQKADNALNNQSLVVLFTFQGKTLLFSGDAQWGNWANFLFGGAIGTPGHTSLTAQSKQILGKLDFYKVGHHGSTNATPMDVVDAMRDGCVAMCSTDPGAYGNPAKGTEVPRSPLMAALTKKTQNQLARSDQVGTAAVPPTEGEPPLAAPFSAGPQVSIEYYI